MWATVPSRRRASPSAISSSSARALSRACRASALAAGNWRMSISAVARISSSCRSVSAVGLAQGQCPSGVADGVLGAAGVERRLGGLVQGVHGVAGERAGHAGHPAELGDQLGRRGGVVGEVLDLVEVLALLGGERHRHAGVSLGAGPFGEGLVGDLADDVAAEPPPAAVELEDPVGRQLDHVRVGELLVHRAGELLERHRRPARPEHGGVVDDGSTRRRELVEAGGDEGAQRTGQVRLRRGADRQGGELDEEQRVAATPLDEILDERHRRGGRARRPVRAAGGPAWRRRPRTADRAGRAGATTGRAAAAARRGRRRSAGW